jgi:hypothetical protein
MKILVIGFPRSGTTLMYRVIRMHKNVEKMLFETNMMKRIGTNRENSLNAIFPKDVNIGEKVIYEKEVMGKIKSGAPTPVEYCKRWNKTFKGEARIIQIVRHPYDVWNSILIKKYIRRDKKDAIIKMEKIYFEYIPRYFDRISKFKNCITVKYEDLVSNPKVVIPKVYKHCKLDRTNSRREYMRSGRVFVYKHKGFKIHEKRLEKQKNEFMKIMGENIEGCLKVLNQFPGPEYEK